MKLYHSGGFEEFTPREFLNYTSANNLRAEIGIIKSLRILERKFLSNKGNALDGIIQCEDKIYSRGLNIGGNPIGTGYENYIQFLEEMNCKKIGHLYILDSLIEHKIPYIVCEDTLRGFITPKEFSKLAQVE